jgi:hypothetical protein
VTGPAGPSGATGPTGPPLTFSGAWDSGTTYTIGQVVSDSGSSYVSRTQPNLGNDPTTDTTDWSLLAQRATSPADTALVTSGGTVTSQTGDLSGGNTGTGTYSLTNPNASNNLTTCAIVGTPNSASDARLVAQATGAHTITVLTFNNLGVATNEAFSLMVSC